MPLTTRSHLFALAAGLSTLAAAAGAAVLHAGDGEARSTLTLRLHTDGEADAVEIDGRTIRVDDGDLPHAVGHPPLAWVDAEGEEADRLEIRLERRAPGAEAP